MAASVLVGISTFNRADLLGKAIESAYDQSHRPLRVAVIDDASTDSTPALQPKFPTVSWERWNENQGYVRARNKMMLTAHEDYYVSLDDDAWFIQNDEIALAVAYLGSHPNVAAVAFDILSPDRPASRARGRKFLVPLFIGCGHVLRLSVVKELHGYKEFPGSYGVEEKDLCLRLLDAGYDIVQFDGVHVWHDKTVTARDVARQTRSGVCNDLTLVVWRFPLGAVFPVLAWKVFSNLRFAASRGLLLPSLKGIGDFLGAFAVAWRGRRAVRAASIRQFRNLNRAAQEISD